MVKIFPIAIRMWTFRNDLWIWMYLGHFANCPGSCLPTSIPTPAFFSISVLMVIKVSNGGVKYSLIINSVMKQTDIATACNCRKSFSTQNLLRNFLWLDLPEWKLHVWTIQNYDGLSRSPMWWDSIWNWGGNI